ncbi:probable receptor-like protein kinase, partial [Tanacetum coccineum]
MKPDHHPQICQRFSLDEIRSATQNFSESLVIGRGGFGKVYKGYINDGLLVAIKPSNSISYHATPQFQAEVEMLSKVRHSNVVSLIGYGNEGNEMALVYEYMPHGTLDDHFHKAAAPVATTQDMHRGCTWTRLPSH